MLLTDLAEAARKSGLEVVELDDWETNYSAGGFDPDGVLCHHTGSFDDLFDADNDLAYARSLAFAGRPDLDPPLCNLALSAEGRVYVCSSGNANHAGQARATGPMPAASDGNVIYIGIEAMNSGTQGWSSKARLADGTDITFYEAYVRLVAALCVHYGWPASHVRAHWETSVTGKWDPGDPNSGAGPDGRSLDMNKFRAAVARAMKTLEDDMFSTDDRAHLEEALATIKDVANAQREDAKQTRDLIRRVAEKSRAAGRKHTGQIRAAFDELADELEQGAPS